MHEFVATFLRSNPQLTHGGYEMTRIFKARTQSAAEKKAQAYANECKYGEMTLLRIERR